MLGVIEIEYGENDLIDHRYDYHRNEIHTSECRARQTEGRHKFEIDKHTYVADVEVTEQRL